MKTTMYMEDELYIKVKEHCEENGATRRGGIASSPVGAYDDTHLGIDATGPIGRAAPWGGRSDGGGSPDEPLENPGILLPSLWLPGNMAS